MSLTCSVCLSALGEELCVPCSNMHKFHKKCLLEWATTLHNCPICREEFSDIKIFKGDYEIGKVNPPKINQFKRDQLDNVDYEIPYDTMACEICFQSTDDSRMLICDACDLGFHMSCLNPPLLRVPRGFWECERCRPKIKIKLNMNVNELMFIDDDSFFEDDFSMNSISSGDISDLSRFDLEDEEILNELDDPNIPSTSSRITMTVKEIKSKRTKRKKRKTKKVSLKSKTKRKTRKRKKNLSKSFKSQRFGHLLAHRQIANVNNADLKQKDKVVEKIPSRKKKSETRLASRNKLDLLGTHWIPPPDDNDVLSKITTNKNILNNTTFTSNSLLDEILENQNKILAPSSLLKVNRNGTLSETEEYKRYLEKKNLNIQLKNNEPKNSIKEQSNIPKFVKQETLAKNFIQQIDKSKKINSLKLHEKCNKESLNFKKLNEKANFLVAKNEKTDWVFSRNKNLIKSNTLLKKSSSKITRFNPQTKIMLMVFPSRGNNEECIVASTSEATASSSVFTTSNISDTPKFPGSKLKKEKNRTSRWEPKSVEYSNNNSKINIDLINFQRNIVASNAINQNSYSNKIDIFNSKQPSPPTSSTNFSSIPSPFNTIPNFSADPNSSAVLQRLFGSNPLMQNLFSTSITPSSTCSSSAVNSSMAAMLATAMHNSKNLIPNSNVFELLNAPNSATNNNLINLANFLKQANNQVNNSTFINRQNLSLPLISNNSVLPNVNGNVDLLNQIFQQQQVNAAAAAASLNSLCFPSTNNSHITSESIQNTLLGTQSQPPSIALNLPPPSLPSSACLTFFPLTSTSNLNGLNSNLLSDNRVIPLPPPLQTFHQPSGVHCGIDSPMDIDDANEEPSSSTTNIKSNKTVDFLNNKTKSKDSSTNNVEKHHKKENHHRTETVQQADAAMKVALKPYFLKRLISKDEYKEIMKKGVAKLREKDSLKPEKVDRFVKQYVEIMAKKRKN